ncbi:MAG: methyltransferase domain-containing protein [Parachlamydiales bacterium]|jgi:ubiquinone/menaquinone biosynthesis C-methylase UbiE
MNPVEYKSWIKGIFNRAAPAYGGKNNIYFSHFADKLVDLAKIKGPENILDVATGRGAVLKKALTKIDARGSLTAVDISPEMIQQLTEELDCQSKQVHLYCMDAEHLEFEDNSFDIIFCAFGVFFFPNIHSVLTDFRRLLKPNGKLLLSTWGKKDFCHELYKIELTKLDSVPPVTLHEFEKVEFIRNILVDSGFQNLHCKLESLDYVYPSIENWIDSLWNLGSRGRLETLSEEQLSRLKEVLRFKLTPCLQFDGLHETLEVIYTQATKE